MNTLQEHLSARSGPLIEALRSLAGCRTVDALRHAIRTQGPLVAEAERFAASIAHVETGEAAAFRDTVRTVRKTLDDRKEALGGVVAPTKVQYVTTDTPRKPEPPATALIVSRLEMRDVRNYERATAQAKASGRTLWIEE